MANFQYILASQRLDKTGCFRSEDQIKLASVEVLVAGFIRQFFSESPPIKNFLWKSILGADVGNRHGVNVTSLKCFSSGSVFAMPKCRRFNSYDRQLQSNCATCALFGGIGGPSSLFIRSARLACLNCSNLSAGFDLPLARVPKLVSGNPESPGENGDENGRKSRPKIWGLLTQPFYARDYNTFASGAVIVFISFLVAVSAGAWATRGND